jgi:hypothetical protein
VCVYNEDRQATRTASATGWVHIYIYIYIYIWNKDRQSTRTLSKGYEDEECHGQGACMYIDIMKIGRQRGQQVPRVVCVCIYVHICIVCMYV